MSLKNFLCTCALALILFACVDGSSGSEYVRDASTSKVSVSLDESDMEEYDDIQMEASRSSEPPSPPRSETPAPNAKPQPKRIIYTAAARARVENLDTAVVRLTSAIEAAGGYISSRHRTNNTYEKATELSIRLPAGQLDGTLALDRLPEPRQPRRNRPVARPRNPPADQAGRPRPLHRYPAQSGPEGRRYPQRRRQDPCHYRGDRSERRPAPLPPRSGFLVYLDPQPLRNG